MQYIFKIKGEIVSEIVQGVKVLAHKSNNLHLIPRSHGWRKKTDS